MNDLKNICVFCGSSNGNDPKITDAAVHLGKHFAENGITLVYGAAKIGIMGVIAQAALDANGRVVGIIPSFLKLKEVVHTGLTEVFTTQTMHERKLKMHEMSDGFIAFPGGIGTLEELFEILTWLQLGMHRKPIGLLNINGFFDDLVRLLETMVDKGFLSVENLQLLQISENLESLLKKMEDFSAPPIPKWLSSSES